MADKYYREGHGPNTPWGKAQYYTDLGGGVKVYGTAGHGGVFVPSKLRKYIPLPYRVGDKSWFEEDCDYKIPYFFLSQYFNEGKQKEHAKTLTIAQLQSSHPIQTVAHFVLCDPECKDNIIKNCFDELHNKEGDGGFAYSWCKDDYADFEVFKAKVEDLLKRCEADDKKPSKLKAGDVVKFTEMIRFGDSSQYNTFMYVGNYNFKRNIFYALVDTHSQEYQACLNNKLDDSLRCEQLPERFIVKAMVRFIKYKQYDYELIEGDWAKVLNVKL